MNTTVAANDPSTQSIIAEFFHQWMADSKLLAGIYEDDSVTENIEHEENFLERLKGEVWMLDYYYNYFDLSFFLFRLLIIKKSGDRFGQDSNENEDDGIDFDIDETDLESYSTVFEDSDEFQIFSESI